MEIGQSFRIDYQQRWKHQSSKSSTINKKCSQSSTQSTISTRMSTWTSTDAKGNAKDWTSWSKHQGNRENKKLTVISSEERKSNDKDDSKFNSQRNRRKAAWEAKDRIFGQNSTDNWDTFGGGNVANMQELLFCLRNETLSEGYF